MAAEAMAEAVAVAAAAALIAMIQPAAAPHQDHEVPTTLRRHQLTRNTNEGIKHKSAATGTIANTITTYGHLFFVSYGWHVRHVRCRPHWCLP